MKSKLAVSIVLFVVSILLGQTDPKWETYLQTERAQLPADGDLLYDGSNLGAFRYGGAAGAVKKVVNADSTLPFGKAIQLTVKAAGANAWEPQFQTPRNNIPVNKGDVLFYIFYIRVIEAESEDGNGQGYFYVQKAGPPYTGLGSMNLAFKPAWRKIYVTAQAGDDYDINGMEATLHLGFLPQFVEIGGIIALNLGRDVDVRDLPQTPIDYDGMEADAPWRAEAAARIEKFRKGDITVLVKNKNGEPIKNAFVQIAMQKHAYGFGTFMSELALSNSPDAIKYKDEVLKLFNAATTPFYMGDGSWGWYASEFNQQRYIDLAAWLQEYGIPTKGHVLVWPAWNWMPPFLKDYENDPEGLRDAIDQHLKTLVPIGQEYGLVQWDVVNEPHINHDVMDVCGEEILAEWYKRVHEIDPKPRLILNEYNIIMGGGQAAFQDDLERYIRLLQDSDAPLGGIGLQCHFDANLAGIPTALATLDRFAKFDLPIQVTEFDIDILDEATQANYTRDFFTAVFSHPATDKIVMWGFWEGDQWKPNGAMIRTDWTPKPNYDVYIDLLFNQWWTDVQGKTWTAGSFKSRAFYGDYKISAEIDGVKVEKMISHREDDIDIEIVLPVTTTGVNNAQINPQDFHLSAVYPNPFNSQARIDFDLPFSGHVRMQIIDTNGRDVAILADSQAQAGQHSVVWAGENAAGEAVSSGVYFCRLSFNGSIKIAGLLLLK